MLQESPTSGIHGNDLMTPPEVLLKRVREEAEKLTKEKEVNHKIHQFSDALLMTMGCHSNHCLTPLPSYSVLSTVVALGRGCNPALGEVHRTLAHCVRGLTLAVCQLSHSTGKILP